MDSALREGVAGGAGVASAEIAVGGGHEVCRGDKVCTVLLDGAGDR
jgi:hypothetical protein